MEITLVIASKSRKHIDFKDQSKHAHKLDRYEVCKTEKVPQSRKQMNW